MDESVQKHLGGRLQHHADAMWRGIARTRPCHVDVLLGGKGEPFTHSCAMGAWVLGMYPDNPYALRSVLTGIPRFFWLDFQYARRYRGHDIISDFEERGYTREEIASRIAAI